MVQKQINSDWKNLKSVKKGNIGEQLVQQYLEKQGFIVYKPDTYGAHGFDFLAVKNKEQIVIMEVKTKARRNYFKDTGVNLRHYKEYKFIYDKYKIPIFLAFVDEGLKQIYGNWLIKLEKPKHAGYPKIETTKHGVKIIYFYQPEMRIISYLDDLTVEHIKSYNTRNYKYNINK